MIYKLFNYFYNFVFNNNISYSTSLDNLLNLEKLYINNLKKKYSNINFIQNTQSFIIDINKKFYFNIKSHSIIIFPKQSTKNIIFIHGNNSAPSIWFETAIKMAENGYIVHCISLPAFGSSTVSEKILNFNSIELLIFYNNYIYEYIINNIGKNNPPIIVGHSFGSFILSYFASNNPHLCKSIILVNGNVFNIFDNYNFYLKSNILKYIINYLSFTYFYLTHNNNLLNFINIAHQICRENFGELIISKLLISEKGKLKMNISSFPYMISTINYPPISILYDEKDNSYNNELLSIFFREKKEIIKINYEKIPITNPDFSIYLLKAIHNPTKLINFNNFKEIYQLKETNNIINNTYYFLLRLLEK